MAQVGFAVTAFFVSFAWSEPLYFLSALVAGLVVVVRRERRLAPAEVGGAGFRSRRADWASHLPSLPEAEAGSIASA